MHNQLRWQLLRGQRLKVLRYNTLGISARGGASKTLWDKRLGLAHTQRTLFSGIVELAWIPLTQGSPDCELQTVTSCQISSGIRLEIKCTVSVMHSNHLKPTSPTPTLPWSMRKPSSMKPVPGANRLGDRCPGPPLPSLQCALAHSRLCVLAFLSVQLILATAPSWPLTSFILTASIGPWVCSWLPPLLQWLDQMYALQCLGNSPCEFHSVSAWHHQNQHEARPKLSIIAEYVSSAASGVPPTGESRMHSWKFSPDADLIPRDHQANWPKVYVMLLVTVGKTTRLCEDHCKAKHASS